MRPSELIDLQDPFAAWCFDRAVATFGNAVENDIRDACRDAKNQKAADAAAQRTLNKWLTPEGEAPRGFRDPLAR